MINIPNDLRKNKDKIIGNMDLRECTCVFLGVILAVSFLYYFRIVLGYKRVVILAFFAGLIVVPFLFFGFKKINGMKFDDYIKVFISNSILSCPMRINKYKPVEEKVKDKKYELVRCYKIKDKKEIFKLRQFLIDRNILFLSEYVLYKNDSYVIFRINCKDMELLQEKRNKEAIAIKNNEIVVLNKKNNKLFIDTIKLEVKKIKNKLFKRINLKTNQIKERINNNKLIYNCNDKNDEEIINNIKTFTYEKNILKKEIKELKSIRKKLKSKTIIDFKDEIDIFEEYGERTAERIRDIKLLKENISNDDRNIYELNLFNKLELKEIMKDLDKIIFISNDNKANIFLYEDDNFIEKTKNYICDLIFIDKKQGLYESIKILEARNLYNFYRKTNSLEEIL